MEALKSRLENEELLHVLKFCQENNVKIKCDGCRPDGLVDMSMYDSGSVTMSMHDSGSVYNEVLFEKDIKESKRNVAEMFLEEANKVFHSAPILDSDIYNDSGETKIVCRGILDGDDRYEYVVLSIEGRHPCTYIKFPGVETIEDYNDISYPKVHGGFTSLGYSISSLDAGVYLGWNYAHTGDYVQTTDDRVIWEHVWTKKELIDEAISTLSWIKHYGVTLRTVIGRADQNQLGVRDVLK